MPSPELPNYLRLHRKRLGFSESDVAFLLGVRHGSQVSRYEHFRRIPSLTTVLAYHVIFRTSTAELFGGKFRKIERDIRKRAAKLLKKLEGQIPKNGNSRKRAWLRILAGESAPPQH